MSLPSLLVLASVLVPSWTHLCLISPPQRGSMMGINTAGAPDCILLKSPCGGREERGTAISLMPHERFVVTFQKNLDHFNKTNPGYFSVSLMDPERPGAQPMELLKMNDSSDPALTLYSANVTMPAMPGHKVMQARYVTNNPQAPPAFYQCADIHIEPRFS
ncbi:hypothetical protein PoB_001356500 [Plakobranchus ocellatus]|uniref:Reelin domain-containing protein n=1 Tax=Plakobranchus ocellatus TaxID=259542 RepID=A0AAV3YW03_9GAST|nr:hypothetical protein PoB_001356500 [Plakobranchus ocellatus]